MINLESDELERLKTILQKHVPDYTVWLFGSRVTPIIKPHSDIDLAIISNKPIPTLTKALLETELAESDLPYKVDVVDWSCTDASFKAIIQQCYEVIQRP